MSRRRDPCHGVHSLVLSGGVIMRRTVTIGCSPTADVVILILVGSGPACINAAEDMIMEIMIEIEVV